ncbi:hypothetical protein NECAME_18062, partial [Necator americanus]
GVAIPIDNGVDGDPEIECGASSIAVNLNTRNIFEGHVYVKPKFLTKVDRAYRVSCFYMEADKDVTSLIAVSDITTESVTGIVQMPICKYESKSNHHKRGKNFISESTKNRKHFKPYLIPIACNNCYTAFE